VIVGEQCRNHLPRVTLLAHFLQDP
jgi:hypothetical protein